MNPQIPAVSLPFTMCHEMAHRMSIALESDANMAAYLACTANSAPEFQYSAYFMAYRYCYNALASANATESMKKVSAGVNEYFYQDLKAYDSFFAQKKNDTATQVATTVNDGYIKVNGDDRGVASYGGVCDLLVNWHIQTVVIPSQQQEEIIKFDPYDESWVFPPEPTVDPTEETSDE